MRKLPISGKVSGSVLVISRRAHIRGSAAFSRRTGFYAFDNSGESLIFKAKLCKNLLNLITLNSTITPALPGEESFAWLMGFSYGGSDRFFRFFRIFRFFGFRVFLRKVG